MLKSRNPIEFGKGLPSVRKQWKTLLSNNDQSFLTDNQLSVFVDKTKPGCECIHFYPMPFPHKFVNGKWIWDELINHDALRSLGPVLDFTPNKTKLTFQPHVIQKQMASGEAKIVERCAVFGNTLIIEWDVTGLDGVVMNYSLPYFSAQTENICNGIVASATGQVFTAISISGAKGISIETAEDTFECNAAIELHRGQKIYLALTCGYDKSQTIKSVLRAAEDPESIFASAEDTWNDYFTKIVPYFSCSDKKLEKLYYYQAYTTRANLYDIPYEPFMHSYTCPWKTGAVWQWSWNTPMNSICERWLNDKKIGAGGILIEGANGGGLNIGTYLHPLEKITQMRGHNEHHQTIGAYLKSLPREYDLPACTTLPHTTPNGLLGAWEFYLGSGDKGFLREVLGIMVEAEAEFSRNELENGLSTCTFVDEFDYSLRLKPYISDFRKGALEMMLKMDTPFIPVDYNCYLYALRERMIKAAAVIDMDGIDIAGLVEKNLKLKTSINKYLWDEIDGFYYDADPRDMSRSGIKCIAGFSALYAEVADARQAARLVEHLVNPAEFGTPYPCPSISMDTADVDPSLPTYGGDSMITSGVWFTVEGLLRYGYDDLAARYILSTIEMVTKDGPSSSYSYHSITGKYNQDKHTLASQCNILTDLICKYIIGINPTGEKTFEVKPIALRDSKIRSFTFGPYNYCDRILTVKWSSNKGYRLCQISEPNL